MPVTWCRQWTCGWCCAAAVTGSAQWPGKLSCLSRTHVQVNMTRTIAACHGPTVIVMAQVTVHWPRPRNFKFKQIHSWQVKQYDEPDGNVQVAQSGIRGGGSPGIFHFFQQKDPFPQSRAQTPSLFPHNISKFRVRDEMRRGV